MNESDADPRMPRGGAVLHDGRINRGTAFTIDERRMLGLRGRLPAAVETLDQQVARAYDQFVACATPVAQWVFLTQLRDTNEVLFFRLVSDHLERMLPVIYTPTVGTVIQQFSHMYRRPRGLIVTLDDPDGVDAVFDDLAGSFGPDDVDLVVASDGEAILGIGDWGVGGVDISIGKAAVYTVAGGVDPRRILAVGLDVGTDNAELLEDPRYLGLRRRRARGAAYDAFVDDFVRSTRTHFPHALLHWEDLAADTARAILARHGRQVCTFDDDIQGTAAVGLACALAGARLSGRALVDQRIVIFGAGSAGVGIADLLALALQRDGLTADEAAERIYLIDRPGLLTSDLPLAGYQVPYAKAPQRVERWRSATGDLGLPEVVEALAPTMLVGTSGVAGAFAEPVVRAMHRQVERPVILPMSNPTDLAEQTPQNLLDWTDGAALVATGSPFPPVSLAGVTYPVAQANNALLFPGLGLGAIVSRARTLPDELFLAGADALAAAAVASGVPRLLPSMDDVRETSVAVAVAVATAALELGIAARPLDDVEAAVRAAVWEPAYLPLPGSPHPA